MIYVSYFKGGKYTISCLIFLINLANFVEICFPSDMK